ncbi:hypothetical protein LJC59_05010 [Desulfovibrio sp. OttesenSCG-928-A18]|nr:hypothetical protein [Desulfovibrio sp. OttesenSCG-928-A18]
MYEQELALAEVAVQAAAEHLHRLDALSVLSLDGKDIKLSADKESEDILLERLDPSGVPTLAEESGMSGRQDGLRWIVDPLDGTYNYFRGLRELSCVSVALWDNLQPLVGVVRCLGTMQTFSGNVTTGRACLNGVPISSSGQEDLAQACLATGFPVYQSYDDAFLLRQLRRVQAFKKIRMFGTAALMSAFVGAGYVDAYSEDSIKLWDIAGGIAVSLAAGGAMHLVPLEDGACRVLLCASTTLLNRAEEFFFDSNIDYRGHPHVRI